jgi:hypothetical protein
MASISTLPSVGNPVIDQSLDEAAWTIVQALRQSNVECLEASTDPKVTNASAMFVVLVSGRAYRLYMQEVH